MRYFYQSIVVIGSLVCAKAYAGFEAFVTPLYWRATETLDWVHTNNLNPSNLVIGFQGVDFHFDPGLRLGLSYEGDWYTSLYFTGFHTKGLDSASGNLTTGFLGGRLSQTLPTTTFYQTGQADFRINFNTLNWDIGKDFGVADNLLLRPLVGLEAAVINQTFNTSFQGQSLSITESVKNNFRGLGPKLGIESEVVLWTQPEAHFGLVADFEMAYLWGHWNITDLEQTSSGGSVMVLVEPRNYGALVMQGMLGIGLSYKQFSVKLGYEINDWFNQCQIFDDETGTQNNDLILQGLNLSLAYRL